MVIVDSSVWIDAFNGRHSPHTRWLGNALSRGGIGLTSLILCEVLRGFRSDQEFELARNGLLILPVFEELPGGLAIMAAKNFRALQKRGITVRKTIDCLIATFCIQEAHQLLHNDNDFQGFEDFLGLQVVHP